MSNFTLNESVVINAHSGIQCISPQTDFPLRYTAYSCSSTPLQNRIRLSSTKTTCTEFCSNLCGLHHWGSVEPDGVVDAWFHRLSDSLGKSIELKIQVLESAKKLRILCMLKLSITRSHSFEEWRTFLMHLLRSPKLTVGIRPRLISTMSPFS